MPKRMNHLKFPNYILIIYTFLDDAAAAAIADRNPFATGCRCRIVHRHCHRRRLF